MIYILQWLIILYLVSLAYSILSHCYFLGVLSLFSEWSFNLLFYRLFRSNLHYYRRFISCRLLIVFQFFFYIYILMMLFSRRTILYILFLTLLFILGSSCTLQRSSSLFTWLHYSSVHNNVVRQALAFNNYVIHLTLPWFRFKNPSTLQQLVANNTLSDKVFIRLNFIGGMHRIDQMLLSYLAQHRWI